MKFKIIKDKIYVKEASNNIDAVIEARDFANKHFSNQINKGKNIIFNSWVFQNKNGEISFTIR